MVEAQQRGGGRPRCAGSADPRQAAKLWVHRLRPQRLAAAYDDTQPALQLLAVAGVHPPRPQFFQRHGAAVAALAGHQVAFYFRSAHRGVRQRPRGNHRMGTPTPPAAQPQNRDPLVVPILVVAAVVPPSRAAACRTARPFKQPPPVITEINEPVAFPINIEYQYWCIG